MKLEFGTGSVFSRLSKNKANFLVNYAVDLGIRKFDTGVNYGNWKTQPLLGFTLKEHLKKNREEFIITSKAGTHSYGNLKNSKNFTPEYIEFMINKSISDMNCKYLDKFYLHGPSLEDIENKELLNKLNTLIQTGKIRQFGVNTHNLLNIKKIASGFYSEIRSLIIDYNLLQQDRSFFFNSLKKNSIDISAGTALCQGVLIQSPLESFIRKRNIFYLLRFLLKKSTKKYLYPARVYREYVKNNFPNQFKSIPLSFVLNNSFVKTIPIGMLSKSSIERNIRTAKKPISKEITNKVGKWCQENCQLDD